MVDRNTLQISSALLTTFTQSQVYLYDLKLLAACMVLGSDTITVREEQINPKSSTYSSDFQRVRPNGCLFAPRSISEKCIQI